MNLMTNNTRHRFEDESVKVNIMGNHNQIRVRSSHFQANIMGNGNRIICDNSKVYLTINGNQNGVSANRSEIQIGVNGNSNELISTNSRITNKFSNGSGNRIRNQPQNHNQHTNNVRQQGRLYQPHNVRIQNVRQNQNRNQQQQQVRRQSYPFQQNSQNARVNQRNQNIQRNQRNRQVNERNSQPNRNNRRAHRQPGRQQRRQVRNVNPQRQQNQWRGQRGLYNFNQYIDNEPQVQQELMIMPQARNINVGAQREQIRNQNYAHQNRHNQNRRGQQVVQVILDDSSDSDELQMIEQIPQAFNYNNNGFEARMQPISLNVGNIGHHGFSGNVLRIGFGNGEMLPNINTLLNSFVPMHRNNLRFAYEVQQDDQDQEYQGAVQIQDSEEENGLDHQQMEMLQTNMHRGTPGKCTICLSEIVQDQQETYLFCFHSFHSQCLANWIVKNPKCPICQLNIKQHIQKETTVFVHQ